MNPLSFIPLLGPLLGGGAGLGVTGLLDLLGAAVAKAAAWLLEGVGGLIATTTRPALDSTWFRQRYGVMVSLALIALLAVLVVSVIHAIVRQDAGVLVRVLLVQLPLAAVLTGAAAGIVQWGIWLVDELCRAVTANTGHDVDHLLADMSGSLGLMSAGIGAPAFVTLVVSLLVVAGAFLLWIEMVLRSAAVDATTLFLPLALVTMTWPAASRIARRLSETIAALVLSKLVVVGVLSLGVGAIVSSGPASVRLPAVLTGMALLLLAAAAPYALLRLVPLADFGAVAHLEGLARRATVRTAVTAWSARSLVGVGAGPGLVGAEEGQDFGDGAPGMTRRTGDWAGSIPGYGVGGVSREPTEPAESDAG